MRENFLVTLFIIELVVIFFELKFYTNRSEANRKEIYILVIFLKFIQFLLENNKIILINYVTMFNI